MQREDLIAANEFCISHDIEISFINSLHESGLIDVEIIEDATYLYPTQLPQLEKIFHFYYDLGINFEGIETINYLLGKMDEMQREILSLRNRLRLYE